MKENRETSLLPSPSAGEHTETTPYRACHEADHDAGTGKGHARGRSLGHVAMMVLCCAAPVLLLSLLPLFARVNPGFGGLLSKAAPFLCPLMMIFMVPMMLKGHKHRQ